MKRVLSRKGPENTKSSGESHKKMSYPVRRNELRTMFFESLRVNLLCGGVVLDAVGDIDGAEERLLTLVHQVFQLEVVRGPHEGQEEVVTLGGGGGNVQAVGVDPAKEGVTEGGVQMTPIWGENASLHFWGNDTFARYEV